MSKRIQDAKELASAPFGRRNLLAGLGLGVAGGMVSGVFPEVAGTTPAYAATGDLTPAQLLARINEIAVYISAANFPDIYPGTTQDSGPGIRSAIATVPVGGTAIFAPGTYRINTGSVNNGKKDITLSGYGVTFIQGSKAPLFSASVSTKEQGTIYRVNTLTQVIEPGTGQVDSPGRKAKLTTDVSTGFKSGQLVKVFSNDVNPDARTQVEAIASRLGEYAVVEQGSGKTFFLTGKLRETYNTQNNVRVVAAPTASIRLEGFEVISDTPALTGEGYGALIQLAGLHRPTLRDIRCSQASNQVIQVVGCFGYLIDNLDVGYAVNKPLDSPAKLGYAVLDNSGFMGTVRNSNMRFIRHAYTDDTSRIAADEPSIIHYGRTFGTKIISCHALGTGSTSFDTHQASEAVEFIACTAVNGGPGMSGFQLRGKKHSVIDCKSIGMHHGLTVITESAKGGESYGHLVQNFSAIDCFAAALSVTVHPDGHPLAGQRQKMRTLFVDGLYAENCRHMLYASNAVVEVKNFEFQATEGVDGEEQFFVRTTNSETTVENGTVDFRKNLRGVPRYLVVSLATPENPAITTMRNVRVKHNADVAKRASRFMGGANHKVTLKNVSWDYSFAAMPGDFGPGSSLNWTCEYSESDPRSDLSSSFYYYAEDAIGKDLTSVWAADEKEVLVQIQPKGKNVTFKPFPKGRVRGMKVSFWSAGAGTATILNGTAANTGNINAENRVLQVGNRVTYQWDGTRWREISFQA